MTSRKAPPKVKEEQPVILESKVTTIIKEADVEDEADDVFVEEQAGGAGAVSSEDNGVLVKHILQPNQNQGTDSYDADRFKQSIEFAKGLLQHFARPAYPVLAGRSWKHGERIHALDREKALEAEKATTETTLNDLNSKVEELDKDIARQENKLRTIKSAALLKEAELMKDFAASCQN